MRHNLLLVGQVLTLMLSLLANTGAAQDNKAPQDKNAKQDKNVRGAGEDKDFGVHRLTIQNGQTRTIHYFSSSSSPTEQSALRELERAENETSYAGDLQALRLQYLNTERALENRRRQVQLSLYGRSIETTTKGTNKLEDKGDNPFASQVPFPLSIGLTGGFPAAFPTTTGLTSPTGIVGSRGTGGLPGISGATGIGARPGFTGSTAVGAFPSFAGAAGLGGFGGIGPFGGFGGFPYDGYPYGGYPNGQQAVYQSSTETFTLQGENKVSHSLAHGIGDEGKFKTEMVAQMARQSSPEYAASTARALHEAASTVAFLTDRNPNRKGVQFAAIPADAPKVIVTLDSNEKVMGYLVQEDANWLVIRTLSGESKVRPAKVVRIDKLN